MRAVRRLMSASRLGRYGSFRRRTCKQRAESRDACGKTDPLPLSLPQELQYCRPSLDGFVHSLVGAALVCTDRDQVAVLLVNRIDAAKPGDERLVGFVGYLRHGPAHRRLDLDGGVKTA